MHLMVGTRPDLAFAVGKLSRFVSGYTKEHLAAVRRMLQYVKRSVDKVLVYDKCASGIFVAVGSSAAGSGVAPPLLTTHPRGAPQNIPIRAC